jgi:cell shape-determining protein MreC
MIAPRTVIRCSFLAIVSSFLLTVLSVRRTTELSLPRAESELPRAVQAIPGPSPHQEELPPAGAPVLPDDSGLAELRARVKTAEAARIEACANNSKLEAKLRSDEAQILELQGKIKAAEARAVTRATQTALSVDQLKTQLAETRKQLDVAERENRLLAGKLTALLKRPDNPGTRDRPQGGGDPGIRGRVLAVNRDYNFVVLNLGARQGVEPNSEMLVMRRGSFIGKIRVSAVEPATTIGDIIISSLARGVQVQPGDTVVYAGTNF